MPRVWVLPEAIINDIDEMVNRLGRDAFPHNGRLHYYSGPSDDVWNLIAEPKVKNHPIAIEWAKAHGAIVIDDSPVGIFLKNYAGMGTRKYFALNPLIADLKEKDIASLKPWKHASHLFALSAHGHITTTVTGASLYGVYYTLELPNTLEPDFNGLSCSEFLDALTTPRKEEVIGINLLPFAQVIEKRDNQGIRAANTMIQLGEIRMGLHEALVNADPKVIRTALKLASREVLRCPAEAYKYFLESRERFLIDRALHMKGTKAGDAFLTKRTPDKRKQQREEQLDRFTTKVLTLIQAEIALMPVVDRPDFIIPSYVKSRAPR